MNSTDVAIIIQGPLVAPVLSNLAKSISYLDSFFPNYDIIVSTFETKEDDDDFNIISEFKEWSKVNYVYAEDLKNIQVFDMLNANNYANQVLTSANAFKEIEKQGNDNKYDYAIKIRTDEYFENYIPLMEKMKSNPDKIICSNIFFRKDFPYHIGDHIISGSYKNLKEFFLSSYTELVEKIVNPLYFEDCMKNDRYVEYLYNTDVTSFNGVNETCVPPECRLAINYLLHKNENPICANHKSLMQKYFEVIDVSTMGEFECKSNYWKFKLNKENYGEILHEIMHKSENKCLDKNCPDFLLCDKLVRQAMLYSLIKNSINSIDELYDLTDDYKTYASVYRPWKNIPEFSQKIHIR